MSGRIVGRIEPQRLQLPEIGRVKVGMKGASGFPQSTDYFIPQGKYAAMFRAVYGEKPATLQIIFIDDDPSLSCIEDWEYRDDLGALFASGDGINFKVWDGVKYIDLDTKAYPDLMNMVVNKCPAKKGWYASLTMRFILPRISGIVGYWQFTTKGAASTIPNLRDTFDAVKEGRGFVKGIIFDLNVQFAKSNKPGCKSRYPVVSLVPNHSAENVELVKGSLIEFTPAGLLGGEA